MKSNLDVNIEIFKYFSETLGYGDVPKVFTIQTEL